MTFRLPLARLRPAALAAALAAILAAAPAVALAAPDFSGFWVLKSDPLAVPKAPARPAAAKRAQALLAARGLESPNGSPDYARVWCTAEGMPWQMTHAEPIDIRQGPLTLTMTFAGEWDARHIYIDGQKHPSEDEYDYTTVGHTIGRWQGDTLVADTMGMKEGVVVIPGGALRTEHTRLTERYRLLDKDTLKVTFTWRDPTTLTRPHTYSYVFERAKGPVWITEIACDPLHNMRTKGMALPFDAPP